MKLLFTLLLVFCSIYGFSQKKTIDHTAYNDWKSLSATNISSKGDFVAYEINPHRGDGYLYLYNVRSSELDSFPRGDNGQFSDEGNFFAFRIKPGFDTLRTCELKKIDKKAWPKDSLCVIRLADQSVFTVPMLSSMKIPENGEWIAYSIDSTYAEPEKAKEKKKFFARIFSKFRKKKKADKKEKISSKGKIVYLFQPSTENKIQFNDVTDFSFSEKGDYLLYTQHQKVGKVDKYKLSAYEIAKTEIIEIDTARQSISNVTTSKTDKF